MAKDKMKAWYDDIDAATLQRIKTYSAFNDAKSKNLMIQTMYEYREKEIQDFKETNHELAETCIARKKRIAELEKENAELKEKVGKYQIGMFDEIEKRDRRITKAEEYNQKVPFNPLNVEKEIRRAFQKGAEFGYNKANEWHYPSKGEHPKDEKKVLVQLKDVEEPILDYYRQDGLWNYALENEVIAWKEIVLSKE